MICNQCGAQLPDGAVVCNVCGKVLSEQPPQPAAPVSEETVAGSAPVSEAVPTPQPQPEQSADVAPAPEYFAQAEFEPPVKKKKSKKGLIIGISAGVVAIAALVWLFFFSPWFGDSEFVSEIKGDYIKDHGTSDEYAQFVEDKTLGGYVDSASSAYGKVLNALGNSTNASAAGKMQLDIVASEDAIDLLERLLREEAGVSLDLDWIDSVSLLMDVNSKDMLSQIGLQLMLDGQLLADADVILDNENYELYIALLNFSDKYLGGPFEVDESTMMVTAEMGELLAGMKEHLPTEKQFDALLNKYIDIIIKNITETAKSEETLEIGTITQKLTVVEYSLDTDTIATVARAVLETAKEDEELAGYIRNVAKYLEDKDVIDEADDVYDSFKDGIRDMISDIKDNSGENEKIITIVNYVDDTHRVVGRSFKPQYGEPISFVTLSEGEKFATLVEFTSTAKIEGEGTNKNGIINAEYAVKVDGARVLDIAVVDYDTVKLEQGCINGTVRITPTSTLLKNMRIDPAIAAIISTAGFSLEMKVTADEKEGKIEYNILSGNKTFLGVHMSMVIEEAQDITEPSSDKVIAPENAYEWAATFDFTQFIDAVKKTSLPQELVNMIEMSLSSAS